MSPTELPCTVTRALCLFVQNIVGSFCTGSYGRTCANSSEVVYRLELDCNLITTYPVVAMSTTCLQLMGSHLCVGDHPLHRMCGPSRLFVRCIYVD